MFYCQGRHTTYFPQIYHDYDHCFYILSMTLFFFPFLTHLLPITFPRFSTCSTATPDKLNYFFPWVWQHLETFFLFLSITHFSSIPLLIFSQLVFPVFPLIKLPRKTYVLLLINSTYNLSVLWCLGAFASGGGDLIAFSGEVQGASGVPTMLVRQVN